MCAFGEALRMCRDDASYWYECVCGIQRTEDPGVGNICRSMAVFCTEPGGDSDYGSVPAAGRDDPPFDGAAVNCRKIYFLIRFCICYGCRKVEIK